MLHADKKTFTMKPLLYLITLVIFTVGLSSCSKDNDTPAAPAVVGRWMLSRGLTSGYTNTNFNNVSIDLYLVEAYANQIDIYNDKTFNAVLSSGGLVDDYQGTWTFTNNVLTLTYNDGSAPETYNYTKKGNVEELAYATLVNNYAFPFVADTTNRGNLQLIYRK